MLSNERMNNPASFTYLDAFVVDVVDDGDGCCFVVVCYVFILVVGPLR